MVASRRLYLLLLLQTALLLFAFWFPFATSIVFVLNWFVLFFLIVDYALTAKPSAFNVTRIVAEKLSIGRNNPVEIMISSQVTRNLSCHLRDLFPQALEADAQEFAFTLAPKSMATLRYNLLPRSRGAYEFGDIQLRYLSVFGLFWRQVAIATEQKVKVYPDLKALQELSVKLARSSELGVLKVRRRGQGTDFASLREYVNGDDVRRMDWKATARKERPVLRIYEIEQEQTLMVLVDAGRMMTSELEGMLRFDHALNAALSLALTGLTRNDQVGLGIFADKPLLYMPPRRGKTYMTRMVEAVHDIRPRMVESDYMGALAFFASAHKARSLMVVITDLNDPTGSQALLSGLSGLSPRHLPFCVTLRDRQIDEAASPQDQSVEGIFRRAVAIDLTGQRELAFSQLARRGCLVLDSPPMNLSAKLVDKYLEVKARGLL
ncbi:MAG: DUF58 domain-containing protein [Candidatus Obscuribacterales bacterium]|nr:DUF58 domain-containing protein [Candidatus Obscuribacterales bacterium]